MVSVTSVSKERKAKMFEKTKDLFSTHEKYMILNIHKVQSTQFKDIIDELPSEVKILFAKNKIIKKVLSELDPVKFKNVIDNIKGNVLIAFFDNSDPKSIYNASNGHLRDAHAVAGDVATKDVVIPAGPTGMPPEKINLFQNAKITTKINKSKIDVVSDHTLIKAGETVGISEANLLTMLNIKPFAFGLDILKIFEGKEIYGKDVLLIDESDIEASIAECVSTIAAFSLGAGITTEASLGFEISNAFADIRKVALGLNINMA
ncbi:large subunit ribosomal protein LP0 [Enteropsectra breve]|nr:large subunit ribosomal protein LP0 [Enteropsectra breve]